MMTMSVFGRSPTPGADERSKIRLVDSYFGQNWLLQAILHCKAVVGLGEPTENLIAKPRPSAEVGVLSSGCRLDSEVVGCSSCCKQMGTQC